MQLDVNLSIDFLTSAPVARGHAVCVCHKYIVITETEHHSVAVYDTATLELVSRFGTWGTGRGQFAFTHTFTGLCAGPSALLSVFIADGGNRRVSEHLIPSGDYVRWLGLTHLRGPRGVDANDAHVAVSDWYRELSRVLLFSCNAVDDVAPLWVFGGARGFSLQQLYFPYGLRLSHDGSAVYVADCWNHRVLKIPVNNAGSDATVITTGLKHVTDVIECEEGELFVANCGNQLEKLRCGGTCTVTRFTRGDRQCYCEPSGLALCPTNGLLVIRDDARLQLFNVMSSRVHVRTPNCHACRGAHSQSMS